MSEAFFCLLGAVFGSGGVYLWIKFRVLVPLETSRRRLAVRVEDLETSPGKAALQNAQKLLTNHCAICGKVLRTRLSSSSYEYMRQIRSNSSVVIHSQQYAGGSTTYVFSYTPMEVCSFKSGLVYYICGDDNPQCKTFWEQEYKKRRWAAVHQTPDQIVSAVNGESIDMDPLSRAIAALPQPE